MLINQISNMSGHLVTVSSSFFKVDMFGTLGLEPVHSP